MSDPEQQPKNRRAIVAAALAALILMGGVAFATTRGSDAADSKKSKPPKKETTTTGAGATSPVASTNGDGDVVVTDAEGNTSVVPLPSGETRTTNPETGEPIAPDAITKEGCVEATAANIETLTNALGGKADHLEDLYESTDIVGQTYVGANVYDSNNALIGRAEAWVIADGKLYWLTPRAKEYTPRTGDAGNLTGGPHTADEWGGKVIECADLSAPPN